MICALLGGPQVRVLFTLSGLGVAHLKTLEPLLELEVTSALITCHRDHHKQSLDHRSLKLNSRGLPKIGSEEAEDTSLEVGMIINPIFFGERK